ncbi:linear amide C-N hydrolase [Enterobacter sp. PGRG2]|uniref:linear amide C-N hydrolase n=1 Tax=Enterobacter sp. PGRG2 TaxID=3104013 RepID=UPI002ABE1B44|nr:linear amide C-N hydrolase [Enterobacter sp. PGRG2]WJD48499.1 linear amide C-N hydrolase [Enterobacter sp. PGRG2]
MSPGPQSGMNEKGLQADLLYLGEAKYGKASPAEKTLEAKTFIQYVLDNFATVEEAEKALKSEPIHMISKGMHAGLHYMVTDRSGANMIIEIAEGKLKIYPKAGNAVMTNDPSYESMLKIYDYYKEKDLARNMPGSPHSVDRFMRAAGWLEQISPDKMDTVINLVPGKDFAMQVRMSVLSVMRTLSTPFAISTERNPENSTTLWRGISDLKNNIMMFDLAGSPSTVWVDLNKIDFSQGERALSLSDGEIKQGDVTRQFTPVQ